MLKINQIQNINIKKPRVEKASKKVLLKSQTSLTGSDFNKYLVNFGSSQLLIDEDIQTYKIKNTQELFEEIKNKDIFSEPKGYFNSLLENEETAYHLIKGITVNSKNREKNLKLVEEKLGKPLYKLENYQKGFELFQKRFIEKSNIQELLAYRPDWKTDILEKKLGDIHNMKLETPNNLFESEKELENFIENLKIENSETIDDDEYQHAVKINGKTYKFKEHTEGKSNKDVFEVFDGQNTFIVKKGHFKEDGIDSIFRNACFCYHLNQKECQSVPQLYYFNNKYNTNIYENIEGNKIYNTSYDDLLVINSHLEPYHVRTTDMIGHNNIAIEFFDSWKLIDLGETEFNNPYKPIVAEMNYRY